VLGTGPTVSLYLSGQIELQRPLSGEAHGEQGEAVSGHVEGAGLAASAIPNFYLYEHGRKIALVKSGTALQPVDGPQHVLVQLPEEVGHVPAVGEHLAVLDGHDGVGGGLPPVQLPPSATPYRHRDREGQNSPAGFYRGVWPRGWGHVLPTTSPQENARK
jgi:hypothetical protein